MRVIADIETNRLENPDKIWCIVCKDIDTGSVHVYRNVTDDPNPFRSFAKGVGLWIGHNFIGYDWPQIRRLIRLTLDPTTILDTLILSRLYHFSLDGGHSLAAWGERFGRPKKLDVAFDTYSEDIVERCVGDVEINEKLYRLLDKKILQNPNMTGAVEAEHQMAFVCWQMQQQGFHFNETKARMLHSVLSDKLAELDQELVASFQPRARFVKEIIPKAKRCGELSVVGLKWLGSLEGVSPGATFSRLDWETFDPASLKHVKERMWEAGWQPVEKTKGHIEAEREEDKEKLEKFKKTGWKVSERNLATLPADAPPAAHKLVERLILASRVSSLDEWFAVYRPETRCIHGTHNSIGTWTHRMSHVRPNISTVPSKKVIKYYGGINVETARYWGVLLRSCWTVEKGNVLIGTDADAIHARILAHLTNEPLLLRTFTDRGADLHEQNKKALGDLCRSRDQSKTFFYAFLNGAGVPKVAEVLGCKADKARESLESFFRYYPGLDRFRKEQLADDKRRGYLIALDGRRIVFPSDHVILAGHLQSGEQCIMKLANLKWRAVLKKERIPFRQVVFNHDEWQTEVPDDPDVIKFVKETQCRAIAEAGRELAPNCPFTGKSQHGYNWAATH